MTYRELTHALTDDTKYFSESNLVSGNYKIFVPKDTRKWRISVQTYLYPEEAVALVAFDAPAAETSPDAGADTRKTLKRLWNGEKLRFSSPPNSGGLTISTPEQYDRFVTTSDRWLYVTFKFPAGLALSVQSQLVLDVTAAASPIPTPVPAIAQNTTKIKSMLIGDSVLYGSLGPGVNTVTERLVDHPQLVLNRSQEVFDFCYNYAKPGASFAGILSVDSATREANGLPNGITLSQLLQQSDAQAVLFSLGGNDYQHKQNIPDYVKQVAQICQAHGKIFAFVGLVDINASSSYTYAPNGTSLYNSGYLHVVSEFAAGAELLRQTCRHEGYPFVDIRNGVSATPWESITGDIVHPSQQYSTRIFEYVASSIAG